MNWWKEKVGNKLPHTDSPSSPSHAPPPQDQTLPLGDRPQLGSVASYIYSFIPGVNTGNGSKSNELTHQNGSPLSSLRLFPSRWRRRNNYWKDLARPPDETDYSFYATFDSIGHTSEELLELQTCCSEKSEDISAVPESSKFLPDEVVESSFISPDLYEFLHACLPNIVKGCQWMLLYSTLKHGISLRTLVRKSAELPGYCLLIVGDKKGAIFGGLLEGPLQLTAKRKYQGTNQTFVFTTIYGNPRLFRATGANRFYYLCLNDLLAFGGGGSFALCLDGDLLHGTSGPCETFGSLCLANSPEFELRNVEEVLSEKLSNSPQTRQYMFILFQRKSSLRRPNTNCFHSSTTPRSLQSQNTFEWQSYKQSVLYGPDHLFLHVSGGQFNRFFVYS